MMKMRFGWAGLLCWVNAVVAGSFVQENPPTFSYGAEFPGATGSVSVAANDAVLLNFDFTGGGNYVEVSFPLKKPVAAKTVCFTATKPEGCYFTVRVSDSAGQTFQKSIHVTQAGTSTYGFDMENWSGSWGGANDGVVVQPLKRIAILLENGKQSVKKGQVVLSDFSIEPLSVSELAAIRPKVARISTRTLICDFGNGVVNAFERQGFSASGAKLEKGLLTVDFSKQSETTVQHSLAILGVPDEFLLTVEADASAAGAEFELGIGSHFMQFKRSIGTLRAPNKKGEKIVQTFVVPAPPAEGWTWSGGANDGKPRFPLRFSRLTIRRGDAPRVLSAIRLVSFEAVTRIPATRQVELRTRLLPNGQRPDAMMAEVRNLAPADAYTGKLSVEVRNWNNAVVATVTTNLEPIAAGQAQMVTIPLPQQHGARFVETVSRVTSAVCGSGASATWTSSWTAPMETAGSSMLQPQSPWGMGIYLYRNANTEQGFKQMDRIAALARDAGVKWTREEFQWQRLEPRRGEFDFSFYDKLVETAQRNGLSVYGLFAYWTPWTKPYEEEGFRDYCTALRKVVQRYKKVIKHWEIYNEPNIFFWSGPHERYPALLKMAYEAVKAEDPEAEVLGCSTAGIDFKFIQMCMDAKAPLDALTIHPYRGVLNEKIFIDELIRARALANNRPVWITEMGWPTIPGHATERQQATYLVRSYLSAIGCKASCNICWYNFKNDGWNPYYNEENFGITYVDLKPKPAYRALAQICRTFTEGTPQLQQLDVAHTSTRVYVFRMGQASAIWSDGGVVRVRANVPEGTDVQNLMGDAVAVQREKDASVFMVSADQPLVLPGCVLPEQLEISAVEANSDQRLWF